MLFVKQERKNRNLSLGSGPSGTTPEWERYLVTTDLG